MGSCCVASATKYFVVLNGKRFRGKNWNRNYATVRKFGIAFKYSG